MLNTHAACPYQCFLCSCSMDWKSKPPRCMLMTHVHAACPCCMSMPSMLLVHAACSCCTCCLFMFHVHAACPSCMSLSFVLVTCPCCMSMPYVHAACFSGIVLAEVFYNVFQLPGTPPPIPVHTSQAHWMGFRIQFYWT
jgi:hypothetical protein